MISFECVANQNMVTLLSLRNGPVDTCDIILCVPGLCVYACVRA
jgi:hypothetical protein